MFRLDLTCSLLVPDHYTNNIQQHKDLGQVTPLPLCQCKLSKMILHRQEERRRREKIHFIKTFSFGSVYVSVSVCEWKG